MLHEERFTNIETEVAAVKTDMRTMNDKLDQLIESMAALKTTPGSPRTTPATARDPPLDARPQPTKTQGTQSNINHYSRDMSNMHHAVGRHISAEEFMMKEMDRDKFEFSANGRFQYSNDFNGARVMAKPYMYLSREGLFSVKHKLEARQSITTLEYVDAFLALLSDRRAFDNRDYNDMLHHLRKVTRDALERSWPAVRRWSQFIWDSIEAGDMCWADRDAIQEERVRLCLTNPSSSHAVNPTASNRHKANVEVICRDYNSRQGCRFREGHGDAHTFHTHCCSYCDLVGKQCYHSVRECERRLTHSRNDNGFQQGRSRQYNNSNNQQSGPYSSYPHQHQFQQNSKNGF